MITFGIYMDDISHYLTVVSQCIPERHVNMYPPQTLNDFFPDYKSSCMVREYNWEASTEVWSSYGNICL